MESKISELFKKLQSEFFDWCTQLSLDEIASNDELITRIEQVERLLLSEITGVCQ